MPRARVLVRLRCVTTKRLGLIGAAERSPSGYRLYSLEAVDRLRFIERAKQLGLPLDEIRDLVAVWDTGRCAHVQASLREQVEAKSVEVQERLTELTTFSAQLDRALSELAGPAPDGPCEAGCGCADPQRDRADVGSALSSTTAPVACTLAASDQPDRLAEWESVLGAVIGREPVPGGIRCSSRPIQTLPDAASLALREQACCSFFTFTVRPAADSLSLDVVAPADAQGIIDDLFGAGA